MNRLMHRKSLVIGAIAAGSTPDTVVWGYISSRTPPVLRIKSGTTVRTLNLIAI